MKDQERRQLNQEQDPNDIAQFNAVLGGIGFESAENTDKLLSLFKKLKPHGGNSFRDAIIRGCQKMQKVYEFIQNTPYKQNFSFVMINIIKGQDTKSKSNLQDVLAKVYLLGKIIPVSKLKIIFINLDKTGKIDKQLIKISESCKKCSQYYKTQQKQLINTFDDIEQKLKLYKIYQFKGKKGYQHFAKQKRDQMIAQYSQLLKSQFLVLLNLDYSDMTIWNDIILGTQNLTKKLGKKDYLLTILFNHQVNQINLNQSQVKIIKKLQQSKNVEINIEKPYFYHPANQKAKQSPVIYDQIMQQRFKQIPKRQSQKQLKYQIPQNPNKYAYRYRAIQPFQTGQLLRRVRRRIKCMKIIGIFSVIFFIIFMIVLLINQN